MTEKQTVEALEIDPSLGIQAKSLKKSFYDKKKNKVIQMVNRLDCDALMSSLLLMKFRLMLQTENATVC